MKKVAHCTLYMYVCVPYRQIIELYVESCDNTENHMFRHYWIYIIHTFVWKFNTCD